MFTKTNVKKELNLLQKAKQDGYNSLDKIIMLRLIIIIITRNKNYHDIKHV